MGGNIAGDLTITLLYRTMGAAQYNGLSSALAMSKSFSGLSRLINESNLPREGNLLYVK